MGISYSQVRAQQKEASSSTTQTYPGILPGFYIGARGGYLFKNKELSRNPAFHLNEGYFGELNMGWRSKSNWLGWNLSAGRLNIKRTLPKANNEGFNLNGYDALKGGTPNWMWDSIVQDNREFSFDSTTIAGKKKTDMESWYAMTGPEFWFGKRRLQGFVSLNAGVGMTKFGYYYIDGKGASSNTLKYNYYSKDNDQVIGPVDVSLQGSYSQYGMSQKAFGSYSSKPKIEDKAAINFMARGAIGLEYYISPKFSIDVIASYWYIMTPDWNSALESKGELNFKGEWAAPGVKPGTNDYVSPFGNAIAGATGYKTSRKFDKKNLGLVSANIGIKFWIGKKSAPKQIQSESTPVLIPQSTPAESPVHKKNLLVTVKDKPTGYALSGVKVTVYKGGKAFYTGMTDANGAMPQVENLRAGNYKIRGILNGIETTIAHLDSSDFEGEARVINRELQHNDLRFTLVGHTLDARTEGKLPHIKTSLTQEGGGENSYQVSDKNGEFRFQLPPAADFTVFAEQKGYFSNREKVTTKGLDRSKTLYVDLHLMVNELKEGASFELKNIYYDFDKSNIRPDAAKVLNDVYKMLIENPTMSIELSSHTDSRGSDSYNLKLSQERANAAVLYLVKKGIDPNRLVAKGYGETKPVNGCVNGVSCTDEQYQANRRTEIKILKK